ncbi:MAG: hypothetical protein MJ016_07705 [Victivallaceae bacterium]|nr:hypothetical protein [Victivallaceae bacterium]
MKTRFALGALTAALVVAGCNSAKYSGKTFEPLPSSTPVLVSWEQGEIDPAKYAIIGRGVIKFSSEADRYDVEAELTEIAQKRGADAVCILQSRVVRESLFTPEPKMISEREKKLIASGKPVDENDKILRPDPDAVPRSENSKKSEFGEEISMRGEYFGREKIIVWAIFWKNRADADPILRQREKLLQQKVEGNWNGDTDETPADRTEAPSVPTTGEKIIASPDAALSAEGNPAPEATAVPENPQPETRRITPQDIQATETPAPPEKIAIAPEKPQAETPAPEPENPQPETPVIAPEKTPTETSVPEPEKPQPETPATPEKITIPATE